MKILYFMHIEWDWIKQRPHFIAEGLKNYYDTNIFILFETSFRLTRRTKNDSSVKRMRFIPIPKKRLGVFRWLDISLNSALVWVISKLQGSDIIWISHPNQVSYVRFIHVPLIYDCMDDHLEFEEGGKFNMSIRRQENEICQKAETIIVSSKTLKHRISQRYSIFEGKIEIVNNGISEKIVKNFPYYFSLLPSKKDFAEILYFGTIGDWFDFSLIEELLEKCDSVRITIIGPLEVPIILHERVDFLGPMIHEEMMLRASEADILIMPFKLNNLVLGVDPVKIYEYLAFDKPIISVRYPEVEKFGDFIYFWQDDKLQILESIRNGKLVSKGDYKSRLNFLESNSWINRVNQIKGIIKK